MAKKKQEPATPAKQSERVMLALTPAEREALKQLAASMAASAGVPVAEATAARSVLLSALRKGGYLQ